MMKEFKYKATFASSITKVSNSEIDKYISLAGLEVLKPLMPKEIDLAGSPDLIGIALNAAQIGRANLNGDSVSHETGVKLAKTFLFKYIDSAHNRKRILGTIVNSGFSNFKTNELISPEEALKSEEPVNIALAGLVYRLTLPQDYIDLIEASADPSSPDFGHLSASWELAFQDYDIAIGKRNLSEAELITDNSKKKELEKYLISNGGLGKKDGELVYRVIKGEFTIGTGIGLVENPAGAVKGLTIIKPKSETSEQKQLHDKIDENQSIANGLNNQNNSSLLNNSSQSQKTPVINIDSENNLINKVNNAEIKKSMKISKIEELNDENLKLCVAADMREFITTEIQKGAAEWVKEKNSTAESIKSATEKHESLLKEHETMKTSLSAVQAELDKLKKEQQAVAEQELFNQRLSSFDDVYELDSDDRKAIAEEIKGISAEKFTKYQKSLSTLLKGKNKETKAAELAKTQAAETARLEAEKNKNIKTAAASVVDKALENADKDKITVPNAASGETPTLKEKYAKAFASSEMSIQLGRNKMLVDND